MQNRKNIISYVFLCALIISGLTTIADETPRPGTAEITPHFVEAIEEAGRRLAVIEPVSAAGDIAIPIATGLFVSSDGGVITGIAAVAGAEKIFVTRLHEKRHRARVKAIDQVLGLVFLETPFTIEASFSETADPAGPGEWVVATFAATAPQADGGHEMAVFPAIVTATDARINISGRPSEPMLRLNSRAPAGSATAPVFNSRGGLEGILVAVRDCSEATECSYVLPEQQMRDVVDRLQQGISNRLAWLGVALQPLPDQGVKIAATMRDCPADTAGLQPGDIILSIDGQSIADPSVLRSRISNSSPGEKVDLEIERDGEIRNVTLTLQQRPLMISSPCPPDVDRDAVPDGQ